MSLIYIVFLLLAAYYSLRWDGVTEDNAFKSHRFWLMCIMLICISGFSYGLGGDKFTYMEQFESIPNDVSIIEYMSLAILVQGNMPLWTLLAILAKRCFDSFYALQLTQAIIVNGTFCYIASKYTHRRFIFLIAYFLSLSFFIFNTEVMREGIAIAICMAGMEAYMKGNKKWFYICYAFAILFHISAAVVIIFPFLKFKISFKTLGIAVLSSLAIWVLSDLVFGKIVVSVLGSTGAMATKIIRYSSVASNLNGYIGSLIRYMILPFIVMYYSYYWEEDQNIKTKKERLISFHLILAICACSLAGFTRFRNYMEIYYLIMLSDFIYMLFKTKEKLILRVGTLVLTVFFLLWLQYFVYFPENKAYFYQLFTPYRCILNENKDVYFREEVHIEATRNEISDEATRDIK